MFGTVITTARQIRTNDIVKINGIKSIVLATSTRESGMCDIDARPINAKKHGSDIMRVSWHPSIVTKRYFK